jgi:hypothetical protein
MDDFSVPVEWKRSTAGLTFRLRENFSLQIDVNNIFQLSQRGARK